MAKLPRYMSVYASLKNYIRNGEYEVGDFLPTENELSEKFTVSRTTIRKAIQHLVLDGYIKVTQGRGTEVLDFRSTQKLNAVTSITETLRNRGYKVEVKNIYIDIVKAKKTTALKLSISENSEVYRIQRIILADEIPTAIVENFIPLEKVPNIEKRTNEIESLYTFLESEYGHYINSGKDIISAKSADFTESQMLDTKPNAALITIRRTTYINKTPFSYDKSIIRADKYQLEVNLTGRNN